MNIIYKKCTKCRQEFPATLSYFQAQKTTSDGLHSWCKECKKEYARKYNPIYYKNNKEKIITATKNYYYKNPEKQKAKSKKYYKDNKELCNEHARNSNKRLRLDVLTKYGGKCECCNENKKEFLAIDHIDGGGCKHRKRINSNFYRWLKRNNYPLGFRVLCHNCNMALGLYGYCPHKN